MRSENEKKLKKIERISKVMRVLCKVALAIVTAGFLVATAAILVGKGVSLSFSGATVPLAPVALPSRIALVVIAALTAGVFIKGLYHLHRLFGDYGRGEIFTTESASQIRQLGITAIMGFGANILWIAAVVAFAYPPVSTIQFHSDGLIIGPIIIVISWFMEMAAEMREENELTV